MHDDLNIKQMIIDTVGLVFTFVMFMFITVLFFAMIPH